MNHTCAVLLLTVMLAASAAGVVHAQDTSGGSLTGLWLTQDGEARVQVDRCSEGLCGRIVWMKDPLDESGVPRRDVENPDPALRDRPVMGLTILRIPDTPDARGAYGGGRIYDPMSGRTYRCTLRPDGEDALKMRGYIGISLLGRTSRWVRVESAEPESKSASARVP